MVTNWYCLDPSEPALISYERPAASATTVSNDTSVCSGANSILLNIWGQAPQAALQWEQSFDGITFAPIPGATAPFYAAGNLTADAWYRVLVDDGPCAPGYSDTIKVSMLGGSAGTMNGSATHCSATNSGRLELTGYAGNVVGWEVSNNGFASSFPFSYFQDYFDYNNIGQPTWFRAVVEVAPGCTLPSSVAVVDPTGVPPVGGSVTGPFTLCKGPGASANLNLTGHTGTVVRWEYSINNFSTSFPIANTSTAQPVSNITQPTSYRAVVNDGSCDGYSAPHTIAPADCCPTPINLQISQITGSSFRIDWTHATNAALLGFNLHYREAGGQWQTQFASSSWAIVAGLKSHTSYDAFVTSLCSSGSAQSVHISATTNASQPCSAPSGLAPTFASTNFALVIWQPAVTASGYEFSYRRDDAPGAWTTLTTSSTNAFLSSLSQSTWYRMRVRSLCGGQTSAWSPDAFFQTLPVVSGCGAITNLTVSAISANSATLNWVGPAGASRYRVEYRVSGAAGWQTETAYGNSHQMTGLTSQTTYEYRVAAQCGPNNGPVGSVGAFATLAPACQPPSGISLTLLTATSAQLSWPPVNDAVLYAVQYRPFGASAWSFSTSIASSTNLTGLNPGQQYEVRIRTYCNTLGVSSLSGTYFFATNTGIRAGAEDTAYGNLSVYPNPNNGSFTVALDAQETGTAQLALFDARGAKVWTARRDLSAGANNLRVNAELPGGLYLLELTSEGRKQVVKLVVE